MWRLSLNATQPLDILKKVYRNRDHEKKKKLRIMFKKVVHIFTEYKILRGMLSYAVLWPVGSLIEQTWVEKRNWQTYNWNKCLRCEYGILLQLLWFIFRCISCDYKNSLNFNRFGQLICDLICFFFCIDLDYMEPVSWVQQCMYARFAERFIVVVFCLSQALMSLNLI